MIGGFEMQTEPLCDYERTVLLPVVAQGLRSKIGKAAAVSNRTICAKMQAAGYKLTPARLRKVINHIRCNGVVDCLVATSDGYYVATSAAELLDYEQSLLGREQAIAAVRRALHEQRCRRFNCACVSQLTFN